ncbi:MAG: hypothetical protein QOG14_5433 [Mycobacterium sp.]|nr:hypothetical protein [Mycobacterium sp.]
MATPQASGPERRRAPAPFAPGVDILRCDQAAIESAKETVLEIIGRPIYDQLRVEAMWGYAA